MRYLSIFINRFDYINVFGYENTLNVEEFFSLILQKMELKKHKFDIHLLLQSAL